MDGDLFQLFLIAVLLFLSAVFSGTETALLALGEAGVHRHLDGERRPSRLLTLWRQHPNRVLSSLLIANNLVNILASAVATNLAGSALRGLGVRPFMEWGMALAVGVMTFLIVTFGEIVPKTFARHNAHRFVPLFPVTLLACVVLRPFSSGLERVASRLIRAAGGSDGASGPRVTEAEVEAMIRLGTAEGALSGDKKALLSSVIEFSETMTKEIMVPRTDVVGFPVEASLDEVLRTVAERKFSRYPVYDGDLDSVVGILTVKDLLRTLSEGRREGFSLRALVSPRVLIVPETKKIGDLLKDFQAERVQMAVAVDEFGGTAGIVTTEDVIEEIVGEIYDEYERAEEDIQPDGPDRYVVQGRTPIESLAEVFGVALPDQDNYETVGGLVLTQAGRLPHVGEAVDFAGLRFEVRERSRTRILKLGVSRAPAPEAGPAN